MTLIKCFYLASMSPLRDCHESSQGTKSLRNAPMNQPDRAGTGQGIHRKAFWRKFCRRVCELHTSKWSC